MPKRVLVVDDDDNTRRFLTVALEENGYEAITAEDGDDGYKKIQESIPDLILLDVMMPKKTGFSLFKQLRRKEEYKDIPVIMLTGVAGVLEEDDAQAEGDTFESPFFDHFFGSTRYSFLRGLEKKNNFAFDLILSLGQELGNAHYDSHVPVVGAGMGCIRVLGDVLLVSLLLQRKSIHIRPQGHGPASGLTFEDSPQSSFGKGLDGDTDSFHEFAKN